MLSRTRGAGSMVAVWYRFDIGMSSKAGSLDGCVRCTSPLTDDQCAGLALQRPPDVVGIGDERLFASTFEEADDGLDLGSHGAFGKVFALCQVLLGLIQGD